MPENPPPNEPGWAPQIAPDAPGRAPATALGAGAALTLVWGPVSGLTGRHNLALLPVLGTVLAIALASTQARRAWFPLVASVIGFAVGRLGDIAAALLLWGHDYAATFNLGHLPQVAGAVNDEHSVSDWGFFLACGALATVTTAARHKARPLPAECPPR